MENKHVSRWMRGCSVLCFLIFCINLRVLSQTISIDSDFITWKIAEVRNTLTGEKSISADVFKSSPDSLVWMRDHGKVIDKLHIDSKFETWPDVSADGSTSYNVIWKNIPGRIAFQRDHGEAKITTEFFKGNVNIAPYEFSVSQVIKD